MQDCFAAEISRTDGEVRTHNAITIFCCCFGYYINIYNHLPSYSFIMLVVHQFVLFTSLLQLTVYIH